MRLLLRERPTDAGFRVEALACRGGVDLDAMAAVVGEDDYGFRSSRSVCSITRTASASSIRTGGKHMNAERVVT